MYLNFILLLLEYTRLYQLPDVFKNVSHKRALAKDPQRAFILHNIQVTCCAMLSIYKGSV